MEEYKQTTMFEEEYIYRTTGSVTQKPDNALTELIANAWDAGARNVNITIPEVEDEKIVIEDDGTGMTEEEFRKRWLTLNYNRIKNQGIDVEFPKDVENTKRKAYGRNGIGRHSMFCFNSTYKLSTWKDGKEFSCDIDISSGSQPFKVMNSKIMDKKGHGTRLETRVKKNLPNIPFISEVLSARYLFDPMFSVKINDKVIELSKHSGLKKQDIIQSDDVSMNIYIIESYKTAMKSVYHGIAFWVGKRLVGEPSWELGKTMIRDGRTQFAKRYTVIITTDDLYDEVLPDWTGFKDTIKVDKAFNKVKEYIENYIREINREKIEETKLDLVRNNINKIKELNKNSQNEMSEFIDNLIEQEPDLNEEMANIAIDAMVNIQKARSGQDLLKKLAAFSEEDIDSLNNILETWTIKDIQNTLDTIDKRILVIEAIERLCSSKDTDELHTLHPLVAQARWLFGPEYDSEMYTFNKRLKTIVKDIIKSNQYTELDEPARRPDLVIFSESSFAIHELEDWNSERNLSECKKILIIELKKGGFEITRKEIRQATDYVDEISHTNHIASNPQITAYVVGDKISNNMSHNSSVGENKIFACTYLELVNTAKKRLFKLKETLSDRYEQMPTENIVQKVLNEPKQIEFSMNNLNKTKEYSA